MPGGTLNVGGGAASAMTAVNRGGVVIGRSAPGPRYLMGDRPEEGKGARAMAQDG